MSTTILIVEKTGSIKSQNIKTFQSSELYKKAALKNGDGFILQTTWNVEIKNKKFNIEVYGKTTGRAGNENKYDFPPPIDNKLFFGSCILVNKTDNDQIANLTTSDWQNIYEHLFGGFEDLGDEDTEDDENYENDEEIETTTSSNTTSKRCMIDLSTFDDDQK